MKTLESTIGQLFLLDLDDRALLKALRKQVIKVNHDIGKEIVTEFLAEMYLFYADTSFQPLADYLLMKYERHHHHNPVSDTIIREFTEKGVVVLTDNDEQIKVVHQNTKSHSREQYPIQISSWVLSRGVCGDSVYCSLTTAINEGSLTSLKIVPDCEHQSIENQLIQSEALFQYQHKAETGQFRLN